ncbi:hypothetical protein P692DRAFT_20840448 [Suillus brevipes Sb2]|nr:hypothetical protein P692DRAFT_20840448 [Suillus brevipes Sb2]
MSKPALSHVLFRLKTTPLKLLIYFGPDLFAIAVDTFFHPIPGRCMHLNMGHQVCSDSMDVTLLQSCKAAPPFCAACFIL